jgi:hypothetical protein
MTQQPQQSVNGSVTDLHGHQLGKEVQKTCRRTLRLTLQN